MNTPAHKKPIVWTVIIFTVVWISLIRVFAFTLDDKTQAPLFIAVALATLISLISAGVFFIDTKKQSNKTK